MRGEVDAPTFISVHFISIHRGDVRTSSFGVELEWQRIALTTGTG